MKARVVAKIIFKNLITGQEIGCGIFSRNFTLGKKIEPGSEISLPVGNQRTRSILGKGSPNTIIFCDTEKKVKLISSSVPQTCMPMRHEIKRTTTANCSSLIVESQFNMESFKI